MIARRSVLIAVCIGLACAIGGARAAEPSAKAFVDAIYAAYPGKDAKGVPLDSNAKVRRYFAPATAALIIKDRKDARGEVGMLDSDPFIDAQDWQIDAVAVAVQDIAANKARATVAFTNLGRPTTVVLDLVKLKQGWRISDIAWDRGQTLRGLLGKK
jgi:uncharacterized protein DUF3828